MFNVNQPMIPNYSGGFGFGPSNTPPAGNVNLNAASVYGASAPQAFSWGAGAQPQQPQGFGWNTNTFNTLGNIAQGAGALMGAWTGLQQLDLAKDQLAFNKETFAKNWANQVAMTNTALRDRQAARASASSYAQPVDEYMAQNKVS